jgi:S1-C subfamily serine protease
MKMPRSIVLPILAGIAVGGVGVGAFFANANPAKDSGKRAPFVAKPVAFTGSEKALSLEEMDATFAALADYVSPSVVHIRYGSQTSSGGQGSGVILNQDGYIITNDHVVAGSNGKVTVILADGREIQSEKVIRGMDAAVDLAVVKINAKDLVPAEFANSDTVRPGQYALAFGAPFGIENTVTVGHISGLSRSSAIGDQNIGAVRSYSGLIQTDAPINPGNSGGALVNIRGQVIGINTAIAGGGGGMMGGQGGNVGIGFAIPGNAAKLLAETLIEKGKLTRAYIGFAPRDLKPYEMKEMKLTGGALIENIPSAGPAGKAGLKVGDVVTRIGSTEIRNEQDLRLSMFTLDSGEKVDVSYWRNGKVLRSNVVLGTLPRELTLNQGTFQRQGSQNQGLPEGRFEDFFERFRSEDGSKGQDGPQIETKKPDVAQSDSVLLGVQLQAQTNRSPGAVIVSVQPGSTADRIGLKAGDVITKLNGESVMTVADITAIMSKVKRGDQGSVVVERASRDGSQSMETMSFTFD